MELKNYLKYEKKSSASSDGNIFNRKGNSRNNNVNKKEGKNTEFFNYNDRFNFYKEINSGKNQTKDQNYIINLDQINNNNNSPKLNLNKNLSNDNRQINISNNNLIKYERNINKNNKNTKNNINNIKVNQIKNIKKNYHIKLENIKNRMKYLLNAYNYLLNNKINLNINEYINNRNNRNNNSNQ